MAAVSRQSNACGKCKGKCCIGTHNLYTAIDYLIRKYSDKPLKSYGVIPKDNELLSNFNSLKKHFRYFFSGSEPNVSNIKRCSHLTKHGCDFSAEDRPIHCLIFACKDFRDGLPKDELVKLMVLTGEMQSIEEYFLGLLGGQDIFKAKLRCAFSI